MASLWHKLLTYLGVGPDDDYEDDYDLSVYEQAPVPVATAPTPAEPTAAPAPAVASPRSSTVRTLSRQPTVASPFPISPGRFEDAQDIADHFREGRPVIMNLQGTPRDQARRLIDFAAGVCYIQGGRMERVAEQVYLLTPPDVRVSDEDRRRLNVEAPTA